MAREKFSKVFQQRLDDIERDAHANGLTITDICRKTKISRATPDRWRKQVPRTIELIDDMEAVVAKHKKDKAGK